MSRRYETVYIFDGSLEEAQINEKLGRFHALVTKDGKGTLGNVSHWGKRTLAYRVKKKDTGYYVVAQFDTAGELLAEYERAVKLDESVLRFMTVIAPPEVVRPAEVAATAPIAAEDDDADEEDV